MSTASSGERNGDADYVKSHENLPTSSTEVPDLTGGIIKLEQMHKVATVNTRKFYQPRELFTHTDEVDPTEIAKEDTTPAENHQGSGAISPIGIQPYSMQPPPADASDALESPSLRPCIDAISAA